MESSAHFLTGEFRKIKLEQNFFSQYLFQINEKHFSKWPG
jgi:hypothetical protein